MDFNNHYDLKDQHALLGASQYAWTNYDENKFINFWTNHEAKARGTELHEFAATCIKLRQKLPTSRKTLNQYVNDGIKFRMTPEQPLAYSKYSFGTADSICFRDDFLRIHDLKTGLIPAKMRQLEVYTAYFCLEYKFDPKKIGIELRIYQNDDVTIYEPNRDDIQIIMDKTVKFNEMIYQLERGEIV